MNKRFLILFITVMMCLSVLNACQAEHGDGSQTDNTTETTECLTKERKTSYSYTDVVEMMKNPEQMALRPINGEVCLESSSHDRRAAYDEATDTYVNWYANSDGQGGAFYEVDDDRGEGICILDVKGAGAVTRFWCGIPQSAPIDIYIDGNRYAFNGSESTLLNFFRSKGAFEGLDALTYYTAAGGGNNYIPITFSQSCKIILRTGWGAYYQLSYLLFGEGVTVERMPFQFNEEQSAALSELNNYMANELGRHPEGESATNHTVTLTLKPGESKELFSDVGKAAVREFSVTVDSIAAMTQQERMTLLSTLELTMYWDGESNPSVRSPLGSFFSNPCGDEYQTMLLGQKDGRMYCYYTMPYTQSASIVLTNMGETTADLTVAVGTSPLQYEDDEYLRFHAKWHTGDFPTDAVGREKDYTFLSVNGGAGRLVGISLHVNELGEFGWWGEGDETFYVDGEKFPSWFGTGMEDYFGYSIANPTLFSEAFHAQIHQEGGKDGGLGHKVMLRTHVLDSVPFQSSLSAYTEKYLNDNKCLFDVTAYFYLEAGVSDGYKGKDLSSFAHFFAVPQRN